jgi:hypothetical protein
VCSGSTCLDTVATYYIPAGQLDGMEDACGTGDYYNWNGATCADIPWGFHWSDVGAGTPVSIIIQFNYGVDCAASNDSIVMNGTTTISTTSFPGTECVCSPTTTLYMTTVSPSFFSAYLVGGTNQILFENALSCEGLSPYASYPGDAYAEVTVEYE